MKKTDKKRLFYAVLSVCLMSTMVACTSNENNGATNASNIPSAAPKSITLSMYGPELGGAIPSGVQTDPIALEIEKATGVKIDLETHPTNEKFAAMVAANDFPDMMSLSGTDYIKPLIESKSVLPLEDLIRTHAPNLSKLEKVIEFSKKYYSNGTGELYFLPGAITEVPPKDSGFGVVLRWDYYKELGYPEIKSGDDWLNVVADMLENHPNTDDGLTRFGFSPWFDWGYNPAFVLTGSVINAMEGISTVGDRGGFMEFDLNAETYTNFITKPDSSLWKGVEFYYKANRRGLLDPDSFTQKYDTFLEKSAADRVLSAQLTWGINSYNTQAADQRKGYLALKMNTNAFVQNTQSPLGVSRILWSIPAESKSPEKAIELYDYLYSYEGARMIFSGIEGKEYLEKDGTLVVPQTVLDAKESDPNWSAQTGIGKYGNLSGFFAGTINENDGMPVDLFSYPEYYEVQPEMNALEQDYAAHYNLSSITEKNDYLEQWYFDGTIAAVMAPAPDNIKLIDSKINAYLDTALVTLMLAKNDQQFDEEKAKIISKVEELGLQQSDDFWNKAWQDALVEVNNYK